MKTVLHWMLIGLFLFGIQITVTASSLDGHWAGNAEVNGDQTPFELNFESHEGTITGRWSLPDLGSFRVPAKSVEFDFATGALKIDSNLVVATVSEETISGTLTWRRVEGKIQLKKAAAPVLSYSEQEVTFTNGDVKLAGTLIVPKESKPCPAVIFLHGSGPATRWGAMSYADRFARIGFASLIFDKRGSGVSTGEWTTSSLDDLARDGLAGIKYLQERSEINPKQIGIWGISQAGWVASRLASITDNVAFVIMVSGGGARPLDSEMFAYQTRFAHEGITEGERSEAIALLKQYFAWLKTGEKAEELMKAVEAAKSESWYRLVQIDRIIPSEPLRPKWSWVASYDPAVDISKIKFPVLLLFGDQDTEQSVDLAIQGWEKGLAAAQNKDYTIRIFKGANHGIRYGTHHGDPNKWPRFAEGYLEMQIEWLSKRFGH